jgi:hypothetical protein
VAESSILGLHWESNLCAETPDRSYTLVTSPHSAVSDLHFFERDAHDDYVVHVGHSIRFTFFGAPGQLLTGDFVDCRRGSPSLRQAVRFEFSPDPRRVLHVGQGIAMRFQGLTNITVRTEPTWFDSSREDSHSDVGNDQIRVPTDTPASSFPSLSVNDLPLPPHVLPVLMQRQLEILRNGGSYDTTFDVAVGGEMSARDRRAATV